MFVCQFERFATDGATSQKHRLPGTDSSYRYVHYMLCTERHELFTVSEGLYIILKCKKKFPKTKVNFSQTATIGQCQRQHCNAFFRVGNEQV